MHNIVDVIENLNFEFSGKKLVNQFQVINFVKFVNFKLFYFILFFGLCQTVPTWHLLSIPKLKIKDKLMLIKITF
jgi:hypothetical protein